jgi:O-antigen ligase
MMMTTVIALYMPGHLRTLPLLAALIYCALNRKAIDTGSALRVWALLFLAYLAMFTVLAENVPVAWKGMYDILRGCLYFFTGYFFGKTLRTDRHYTWLLLILLAVLAGSFLLHQQPTGPGSHPAGFYGYHPNPNNAAFVVMVMLAFILPVLFTPRQPVASRVIGLAGFGTALVLLYYANSRNAWIALFLGLMAVGGTALRNNRRLLIVLGATQLSLLAMVLLYFNLKGFSMPVRIEVWSRLIAMTADEHPWLGYGINNTKEVLNSAGLPVLIAHNLLVDIFVSTGIVGTLLFAALGSGLLVILFRHACSAATTFRIGLAGLVMFGFMSLFDLKFASITLIGAFAFFSGAAYSCQSGQKHTDPCF